MKSNVKKIISLLICLLVAACTLLPAAAYEAPLRIPQLTGDIASDIYRVARSQVGYKEDIFGGTVYGEWWTDVTDIGYDCTRVEWCAVFVCWCMDKAGVEYGFAYNRLSGAVDYLFDLCEINGSTIYTAQDNYTPKSGDLLFYSYDNGETLGHISIADGKGHYVHANYANKVVERNDQLVYRIADGKEYRPLYIVSPNYTLTSANAPGKILTAVLGFGAFVNYAPDKFRQELKELTEKEDETGAPEKKPVVSQVIPGDCDRDGEVTAADARLVLRAAVELETIDAQQMKRADLNADGELTADEARMILRAAVGLETL